MKYINTCKNCHKKFSTFTGLLSYCKTCYRYSKEFVLKDIEKARMIKMKQIEKTEQKNKNPVITKWEDPYLDKPKKMDSSLWGKPFKHGDCECVKCRTK